MFSLSDRLSWYRIRTIRTYCDTLSKSYHVMIVGVTSEGSYQRISQHEIDSYCYDIDASYFEIKLTDRDISSGILDYIRYEYCQ